MIRYGTMVLPVAMATLLSSSPLCYAADYTCSMRVTNPTTDNSVGKGGGKKTKGGSTQVTTTKTTQTWPVSVSFSGKEIPTSGIKLECTYIGMTEGKYEILGQKTIDVKLDEKGVFKGEATSPEAVMTKTKTTTSTGGGGRNGRRGNRGGRSASTKSHTTGTRIAGCIIQLTVGGEVVKSYSSSTMWTRLAKKTPITDGDLQAR